MEEALTQVSQEALVKVSEELAPKLIFKPVSTETRAKECRVSFQMGMLGTPLEVLLFLDPWLVAAVLLRAALLQETSLDNTDKAHHSNSRDNNN